MSSISNSEGNPTGAQPSRRARALAKKAADEIERGIAEKGKRLTALFERRPDIAVKTTLMADGSVLLAEHGRFTAQELREIAEALEG